MDFQNTFLFQGFCSTSNRCIIPIIFQNERYKLFLSCLPAGRFPSSLSKNNFVTTPIESGMKRFLAANKNPSADGQFIYHSFQHAFGITRPERFDVQRIAASPDEIAQQNI